MKLLKILGVAVCTMFGVSAFADESRDFNLYPRCERFSFNPHECNRVPGCHYDWRVRRCEGFEYRRCERFSFNPMECRRMGCEYDWRYRRCFDRRW